MTAAVRALPATEWPAWQDRLAAFERAFTYPLGADRFRIDHGRDYFAFFRRLGEPAPFVAEAGGRIAGMLVAVQRRIDGRDTWYLCDLKVAENGSAARIGQQLLRAWADRRLAQGQPAFGVSMNAADGQNRLVRVARRCREAAPLATDGLVLFSLDHATWCPVEPLLAAALGPIGWFDPRGVKDIVLASTQAPMPLLHAQHGPFAAANVDAPRPGATHMFCLPRGDALITALAARGIEPSATATIVHRHLDRFDWRQLLTSDI